VCDMRRRELIELLGGGRGVGSDCAAVRVSRGMKLVATTDAVVEDVHFSLSEKAFSAEDVGWKALAVNLSDLAAAGARPRWFLCALGVPAASGAVKFATRMARGMAALSKRFEVALVDIGIRNPQAVLQALDLRGRRLRRAVILFADAHTPTPPGIDRLGAEVIPVDRAPEAVLAALRGERAGDQRSADA